MERRTGRGILALGVLSFGLGLAPTGASAQLFGGGGAPMPPSGGAAMLAAPPANNGMMAGMYANPYMNPMMNPYMNPFLASQGSLPAGTATMYFLAAQQANGGIGSGMLGGPKARKPGKGDAAPLAVGELPRSKGSNTPGATASRYFNRSTPANLGSSRYYARQSRYFPNNGR